MKVVLFYHSLISDWNHGNAHFLRGVVTELLVDGHEVSVFEPIDGWSLDNLLSEHGDQARRAFHGAFPHLQSMFYRSENLDLDRALDGADLVIVHEWNDHELVARIGEYRRRSRDFRLLFHDTHHRSVSEPDQMQDYDLRHYDGVLAFGEVLRDIYLSRGWAERVFVWHEAADVRTFRPLDEPDQDGQVVWVGNWGDDERSQALQEFLFEPVDRLGLDGSVHGVRYPQDALDRLRSAGMRYKGWLPNFEVPRVFARHRFTVHIPRQVYVESLPGIPTIRPFEAMACGTPLVCSPWEDTEGLFRRGTDYVVADTPRQMEQYFYDLAHDDQMVDELATNGRERVMQRHTCAHRVDELKQIRRQLGGT